MSRVGASARRQMHRGAHRRLDLEGLVAGEGIRDGGRCKRPGVNSVAERAGLQYAG